MVYIRHRLLRLDGIVLPHIPHARLRPAHQDEEQSPLHDGCFPVLFGNIVLPFSGAAVDHGNLVGLGIGANATAEAASQAHQVVVVEGLVGTGSASPPSPETGGFVPHSIVAIEYDAIDTIITAAQKVLVNLAQSLGHGGNTTTHVSSIQFNR